MRKTIVTTVVLVLLILLQTPVFAASGALTAAPVSGKVGEQVQIQVHLQNPGIVATRIFVRYDNSLLRLEKAENGDVFAASSAVFGGDVSKNPYVLLWDDSLRTDNLTKSGTLCILTFTVLAGNDEGETAVRIAVDKGSTFDVDLKEVTIADASAVIKIPAQSSAGTTKAAETTKADAPSHPAAAVSSVSGSTTTAAAGTTKAAATASGANKTTSAAATTAKADKTTRAAVTTKAPASTTGKAATTATAIPAQGTTAASPATTVKSAVKSTAADTSAPAQTEAQTAPVSEEASALIFAEPETATAETATAEETTSGETAPAEKSGRQLLWLLLLVPVAAVLIVILVRKKKA